MIVDLPQTTTSAVAKKLIKLREEGGAVALGRVLTLIILTDEDNADKAIDAANDASREHPCRIIVLARSVSAPKTQVAAQIRLGGDAGASEVIVLRGNDVAMAHADTLIMPLLLPDAPIVAWWTHEAPANPSAHIVGAMAGRRITDSYSSGSPEETLRALAEHYAPGDTDLAWTRTTVWRALIAATLDQAPFESVRSAVIEGDVGHTSLDLMAAWIAQLLRCPVEIRRTAGAQAITQVTLSRKFGDIVLSRPTGKVAILSQPHQPDHSVSLPVRELHECIAEELRRLDPDEMYGEVVSKGLARVQS